MIECCRVEKNCSENHELYLYMSIFERRISLSTIQVFSDSIRPTTDSSYGDTGSR